jgi:heme oxygenase
MNVASTIATPTTPTTSDAPTLMQRLKATTMEAHKITEGHPLALRLRMGTAVPREVMTLHALYLQLYRALAQRCFATSDAALAGVWHPTMVRGPELEADLIAMATRFPDDDVLVQAALAAAHVPSALPASDVALIGALYVVEGSRLGGAFLAPRIAEGLGGLELSYYVGRGSETMKYFREFGARVNAAVERDADAAAVIDGANWMFEHMATLFAVADASSSECAAND